MEINLSISQPVETYMTKQVRGEALKAYGGPRTPEWAQGPAGA